MIRDIIAYLRELQRNNNRLWFQDNKPRFDRLRAGFEQEVHTLIQRIALFDPEITGTEAKDCIYRIYRDIRFSPDKTPYKGYFSAYIAPGGKKSEKGGYYLHIEPGNCLLSGGVWCPPAPLLKMLRREVFDHIEEFTEILDNERFRQIYPEWQGEVLQRLPQPYVREKAFPRPDLLKRKDYVVVSRKPESYFDRPDWIEAAIADFEALYPFNRFLNYTVDEYLGRAD